jgi:rhodanese-related sulfurtransferase
MPLKQLLMKGFRESLLIIIIAGFLAFGLNLVRQNPVDLSGRAPIPMEPNALVDNQEVLAGVQEITLDEAIDKFRQGTALFVDARSVDEFLNGHIDGAINIPETNFEKYIGPFMAANAPETLLITYCEGKSCQLSQRLAEKLILSGFDTVYHLKDGWGEWKRNGLPTGQENQ